MYFSFLKEFHSILFWIILFIYLFLMMLFLFRKIWNDTCFWQKPTEESESHTWYCCHCDQSKFDRFVWLWAWPHTTIDQTHKYSESILAWLRIVLTFGLTPADIWEQFPPSYNGINNSQTWKHLERFLSLACGWPEKQKSMHNLFLYVLDAIASLDCGYEQLFCP